MPYSLADGLADSNIDLKSTVVITARNGSVEVLNEVIAAFGSEYEPPADRDVDAKTNEPARSNVEEHRGECVPRWTRQMSLAVYKEGPDYAVRALFVYREIPAKSYDFATNFPALTSRLASRTPLALLPLTRKCSTSNSSWTTLTRGLGL